MTLCLDIHTHHQPPQPEAVISVAVEDFSPLPEQLYSVGVHPWTTTKSVDPAVWTQLEKIASLPEVVAIGECGIDLLKGGPLFKQLLAAQKQIAISEKIGKPLILHDVKAHDIIVGLKRDLKPAQNWLVHGFRYKPTVAKMMTDAGIYLSFGENFNPESLKSMPQHMILAETDESPLTIEQIISKLAEVLDKNFDEMKELIAANTQNFLNKKSVG